MSSPSSSSDTDDDDDPESESVLCREGGVVCTFVRGAEPTTDLVEEEDGRDETAAAARLVATGVKGEEEVVVVVVRVVVGGWLVRLWCGCFLRSTTTFPTLLPTTFDTMILEALRSLPFPSFPSS